MKLGTQTGSLVNHVYSRAAISGLIPEVGMGATILCWTDRRPATVIAWDGKILTVQDDTHTRIDSNGMSEIQEYNYSRDPNGDKSYFKKDRNNSWVRVVRSQSSGRWVKREDGLIIGIREKYHDFSF